MTLQRTILTIAAAASLLAGSLGMATLAKALPTQADTQLAQRADRGGHRGHHLAAAAERLGVSEVELRTALGLPEEPLPRPDLAAAATQLGTTEAELRDSLQASRQGEDPRGGRPDLAAVAQQYGVSEAELRTALGLPETPIEPDLAAAATQLGVSEAELRAALRPGCNGPEAP
ncbi:MAG: hypothetical protein ACFCVD_15145 [Nodosilinea sp.]